MMTRKIFNGIIFITNTEAAGLVLNPVLLKLANSLRVATSRKTYYFYRQKRIMYYGNEFSQQKLRLFRPI